MLRKIVFVCRVLIIFAVVGLFGCVTVSDECGVTSVEWEDAGEQLATKTNELKVEVFPQLGHSDHVVSVAFSPDGTKVLSGSWDGTIKLWDIITGQEIRTFTGHSNGVASVAFNPDGTQILSGSFDETIKLWDTVTGQEIRTFKEHSASVLSVAFSPDGTKVLSGSRDGTIKLWDTVTGHKIRTFTGRSGWVVSVAFNPDGTQVLSGSGTIKLWDIITGQEIRPFTDHSLWVESVAFSPDGTQILSGSSDGTIKLWDTITGQKLRTFTGHSDSVSSVAFSPDGTKVLSGSRDRTIKLWDTVTGQKLRTFTGHSLWVESVAFSPDGTKVLSGSWDVTIKLWDTVTGQKIRTFTGLSSDVWSVIFSPDGTKVLSLSSDRNSRDGTIKLWDTVTGQKIRTFTGLSRSIIFSPDGTRILSGSSDGTIKLWDTITGQKLRTFTGHSDSVSSVAFSPDGTKVLSGSRDRTIKLWDTETGQEIRKIYTGHSNFVAFSPDGTQILSRSDRTIKLWDTVTGQERRTIYTGHSNFVAFSPDGTQILSSSGRTIKFWDTVTGQERRTITNHSDSMYFVAFNPDGTKVLSGSTDGTIKLLDTTTGHEIRTFTDHSHMILSVSFNSNGKRIISSSADGTIRLWDIETGKEIASFISFSGTDTQLTNNTRSVRQLTEETLSSIDGEWIVITPDGYYAASPLGDRYLNVRVGNRVTGMDSFRHIFHNPDVVRARLNGEPDPVTKKTITIQEAASFFPSTINMQSPATSTSGVANLSVNIVDENQPIQNIKILVNGRLVGRDEFAGLTGARGLVPERASLTVTGNQKSFSFNIPLALDPGDNLVEVIAFNGYSEARHKITLSWLTDIQPALPNLWILAVGVNNYNDDKISNLNYCANDAREIVRAFREQEGKRYAKVNALVIADGEGITPTAENIRTGLSFLNDAGPRDTILLFLAGHGVNGKDGMFEFLPRDSIKNNDETFSNVITGDEISDVLDSPGNRLIFIDACHSGSVDNDRMVRQFMDTNAYVFASCRGNELSHELSLYRHGVFTFSILQTLRGRRSGILSVMDLSGDVSIDVPRRMMGRQNPVGYSRGFYDFIIGE